MIYHDLKTFATPLGFKMSVNINLCGRVIPGHVIYKIDLLFAAFDYMASITHKPELEINSLIVRDDLISILCGDCSDEQYTAALTRVYNGSPFINAYINYHYIMGNTADIIKNAIIPLVNRVNEYATETLIAVNGTYMAEDSGYLYLLDADRRSLVNHSFVEIR
jgi:hypothetical protein